MSAQWIKLSLVATICCGLLVGRGKAASNRAVPISTAEPVDPTTMPMLEPAEEATPAAFPPAATLPAGWHCYQNEGAGYAVAHPAGWGERTLFRSPETGSTIDVDMWQAAVQPGPELLAWLRAEPGRVLAHTEEITLNASILGYPAVFAYEPAAWGWYDTSSLVFATGQQVFRLQFTSPMIPTPEEDAGVFEHMLATFSLAGRPVGELTIPTGWERGAGLVIDPPSAEYALSELAPDELAAYRQGVVGTVEEWTVLLPLPGNLLTWVMDEGQRNTARLGPFRYHFRGLPVDYWFDVQRPEPQPGDRVLVAGRLLNDGTLLAEYVAVDWGAGWQTFFQKTLFDVGQGEFSPTLLVHYPADGDVTRWLTGELGQLLPLLAEPLPVPAEELSTSLHRNGLAQGKLVVADGFQIRLRGLYVQGEGVCYPLGGRQHCPDWLQLFPPLEHNGDG